MVLFTFCFRIRSCDEVNDLGLYQDSSGSDSIFSCDINALLRRK